MLNEFVEKYSSILNGRDVIVLFVRLRELTNRTEASRICELERRTTYYWDEDRAVRLVTKQKVLRAILEKDFDFAVKYLLSRVYTTSCDMLGLYLGTIYEKAMEPEIDIKQFQTLIEEFRKMRIEYTSLVNPRTNARIYQLFINLQQRARERCVDFTTLPMSTMDVEEISILLPRLMRIIPHSISDKDLVDYSSKFNISQDFLKFVSDLNSLSISVSHESLESDGKNITAINLIGSRFIDSKAASVNYCDEALKKVEPRKCLPESAPHILNFIYPY